MLSSITFLPGRAAPAVSQTVRICRGRDSDFALHRGRFSDFALASDFARKILRKRCDGERIASGVGFHPEKPITGPAPKVRQRCCPRSIADGVIFLTTYTPCRQSCCGNRIALVNPAVATGLLHPILLWQQDCHCQSWAGRRIASPIPVLATGLRRCTTSSSVGTVLARAQACDGVGPAVGRASTGCRGAVSRPSALAQARRP